MCLVRIRVLCVPELTGFESLAADAIPFTDTRSVIPRHNLSQNMFSRALHTLNRESLNWSCLLSCPVLSCPVRSCSVLILLLVLVTVVVAVAALAGFTFTVPLPVPVPRPVVISCPVQSSPIMSLSSLVYHVLPPCPCPNLHARRCGENI